MFNIIIIEDEPKSRALLHKELLTFQDEVKILAEAESVQEGLKAIREHLPDIVFLDIILPDGTGFDLLDGLENTIHFDLVFVTAYNQFALKAFEYSTVDYLVKPLHPDHLVRAMQKIKLYPKRQIKERLEVLKYFQQKKRHDKIGLPTQEGTFFVFLKDIIRCEAINNYTKFYIADGREIMVSKTIKEYEQLFRNLDFFRIHRSHLINLQFVHQYKTTAIGGEAIMKDASTIPIARRRKAAFVQLIQ